MIPEPRADPLAVRALRPPPGWSARVGWRAAGDGEQSHRVLHAATIPMTGSRSDYGSDIAARLGVDDSLVVLLEFGASAVGTALFAPRGLPVPQVTQFDPNMLQRTLPGQSGFQRFFTVDGRAFCLYVVLGSHARRARTVPRVHALLSRVDVADGTLTLRGPA